MQRWAAIDVMGGRVVSLLKGSASSPTDWRTNPLDAARRWEQEGAYGLHIVDLDRAFGLSSNEKVIHEVLKSAGIPVQVGGGIRTVAEGLKLLAMGANRLVVGTLAYSSPSTLRELVETAGTDSVVVAADYKQGKILTHGWTSGGSMDLLAAAKHTEDLGVRTLLVTAVERDGTATGPDFDTYGKLRKETKQTILASGGIRSEKDIEDLARLGVDGVILGRGIYAGSVSVTDAIGRGP